MELDHFYELVPSKDYALHAAAIQRADYSLFDTEAFQKGFAEESKEETKQIHFYLNDMSCYACVWVCEQVTKKIDARCSLSINMATGEASLLLPKGAKPLSEFVKTYESLGYGVTPNRSSRSGKGSELNRIGVAFFCLMNVMMLAFPEYLDSQSLAPSFRQVFRALSAVLAGIAIFYSGWPFLKNAVMSLKQGKVHLDFPIGLALLVGFGYSLMNALQGAAHVYFDSMTAVVALVLSGRFVQTRALEHILREQAKFLEGDAHFVRLETAAGPKMVPLTSVRMFEKISVLPGEIIPLKGRLASLGADISYGLLRGESVSEGVNQGELISAGAMNGSRPLTLEALEDGTQSFLLHLQSASRALYQEKGRFLSLSEKMARFFVVLVLGAAFGVGLWFLPSNPEEGFRRFAAVLLVACPCIFGFGAPLVIARAFQLGLKRGIVFRSQNSLERLSLAKFFYFDKTGTLTQDEGRVKAATWHSENLLGLGLDKTEILPLLRELPLVSRHHVAQGLGSWALDGVPSIGKFPIRNVKEIFGQGLSFEWGTSALRIGRVGFCFGSESPGAANADSYVTIDGKEILRFQLDESLRPEADECLRQLVEGGRKPLVLSGDKKERVRALGQALGISDTHLFSELSPSDKLFSIAHKEQSVMVGNGINDALASSGAAIGIALANASDAMKEASDISFQREGLSPLLTAIALSAEARKVMKRCFALALAFNSIAMSLALTGLVTPVMAAVLMPFSSITVFLSSQRFQLKGIV